MMVSIVVALASGGGCDSGLIRGGSGNKSDESGGSDCVVGCKVVVVVEG